MELKFHSYVAKIRNFDTPPNLYKYTHSYKQRNYYTKKSQPFDWDLSASGWA